MHNQRFHYKVEFVQDRGGSGASLQTALNNAAGQGWQAIHFQHNPNGSWFVIF